MAVKIRLRRMGSRNAAFYRVIVQDARRSPTGRFIETLGWYDPKQDGNNFSLNLDRADYWLGNGAQPSNTAASLIKKARTLPVGQAVAGEVTEEEIPVAAIEAEEATDVSGEASAETEDAVAETDVPATAEATADVPVEAEEAAADVAEEPAADVAEAPAEEAVAEVAAETEEESETKEPVASATADATADVPEEVTEASEDVSDEVSADKEKA